MLRLVLALPLLTGCSLYLAEDEPPPDEPPPGTQPGIPTTTLTHLRSIAGEYPVVGIDGDGAGGIYIAYRRETTDFYEPADVRITHLDHAGAKVSEWQYVDEYTFISGLAYDGDHVWLNYSRAGTGTNHIRKIDPVTGDVLLTFATGDGIRDIAAGDGTLVLSSSHNQVIVLDAQTGGELERRGISDQAIVWTTQRGVAVRGDRYWITAQQDANVIRIVDENGAFVGRATTDRLDAGWSYARGLQLAWDGTSLILAHDNQISWLAVDAAAL